MKNVYCGDFVYNTSLAVEYIITPNGQLTRNPSTGAYTAQYNITDHLENVRSVVNSSGTVLQSTDYYPFGLAFSDANITNNRYLYNGKELEDYTVGTSYLGTLDYGARHYDPRIARWTVPDPLAEMYYGVNAYSYCAGNPVMMVDPDGSNPFVVALIKGAIGAITDFSAQLTITMSSGKNFREAASSVDYTSVGAAFVTSALSVPGMSTTAKIARAGIIAIDAAVDVNLNGEIRSVIENNKPLPEAIIDAASSVIPEKGVDKFTSGLNNAINSDLKSKAAATLTKESKASMKAAQTIVNSTGFQIGANSITDYSGKLTGSLFSRLFNHPNSNLLFQSKTPIQPGDATRVVKYNVTSNQQE